MQRNKPIKIYLNREPGVVMPKVAYKGTSAAWDLASRDNVTIEPKSELEVHTGLRATIEEHEPYYMLVMPRSSLGFKKNVRIHHGVIDAGYTGELSVKVFNNMDEPLVLEAGERFAQVLVIEKPRFTFEDLTNEQFEAFAKTQTRGEGGFGSSNKEPKEDDTFKNSLEEIKQRLREQGYILGMDEDDLNEPSCEQEHEEPLIFPEPEIPSPGEGKITIYGRYTCPYCVKAKKLAQDEFSNYELVFVDMEALGITKEKLSDLIGKDVMTVPQIFVGTEYIGGCDDFHQYFNNQSQPLE